MPRLRARLAALSAAVLLALPAAASAQRVVVSHDDWLTSDPVFADGVAGPQARIFLDNVLGFFGVGAGGSVLYYTGNTFAPGSDFDAYLGTHGLATTRSTAPGALGGYDLVIAGGYDPGAAGTAALQAYVLGGGNVLWLGGSCTSSDSPAPGVCERYADEEAAYANPFLNRFGLALGAYPRDPTTFGYGPLNGYVSTATFDTGPFGPTLFAGSPFVYAAGGSPVELATTIPADVVVQLFSGGNGASTDGRFGAAVVVAVVPEPGTSLLVVTGLALAAAARRRRR